ncbi:MAG: hypothetical protein HQL41_16695, partial [Alphaproteobacteria bacterium]|nr:hypothetical protein [Alphaproteobacteria bacterium]
EVADETALAEALAGLLDQPAEADAAAARALAFANSRAGGIVEAVVGRLLDAMGANAKTA